MIRASLHAVAVIAFHPEGSAPMWRENAPNALGDRCRFFAASCNVCAARFVACARRRRFHRAPRFLWVGGQVQPTAQVLLTGLGRLAILQAEMAYAY
jgi:hypothetical protein